MMDYCYRFLNRTDAETKLAAVFPEAVRVSEGGAVSFKLFGHGWAIDVVGDYDGDDCLPGFYVNLRLTDPDRVIGATSLKGKADLAVTTNGADRPGPPYRWWA